MIERTVFLLNTQINEMLELTYNFNVENYLEFVRKQENKRLFGENPNEDLVLFNPFVYNCFLENDSGKPSEEFISLYSAFDERSKIKDTFTLFLETLDPEDALVFALDLATLVTKVPLDFFFLQKTIARLLISLDVDYAFIKNISGDMTDKILNFKCLSKLSDNSEFYFLKLEKLLFTTLYVEDRELKYSKFDYNSVNLALVSARGKPRGSKQYQDTLNYLRELRYTPKFKKYCYDFVIVEV